MRLRSASPWPRICLGLLIGFGDQHRDVAIGLGADFLALLAALGAELGRFALPLGLHALIDRLAVLLRQIDAADAHVDDVNAERLRIVIELIAHLRHQLLTLVAHRVGQASPRPARAAAPS